MPGKLPTTTLPKRISLTFLWAELSQRDPIPIVNALLKKFFLEGDGVGLLFVFTKV